MLSPDDERLELEDLEELVQSQGWARLVAWAEREWGPMRLGQAMLRREISEESGFIGKLKELQAGVSAVGITLGYPKERLSKLREKYGRPTREIPSS